MDIPSLLTACPLVAILRGIRPEDFEDATKVDRETQERGVTFNTKLDLVEAMGAEFYAHFGVRAQQLRSADLEELKEDAEALGRDVEP